METGTSRSLLDCSRSRRQKHCSSSVGGICDLPDSILSDILSFLPTNNAVATRILSQRWKFLWTMTSNLDFYLGGDKVDQDVRFVNHVLLFHKPGCMNKLSLTWKGTECIPYYVNTWINTAIARNVRDLVLDFGLFNLSVQVQRSFFSCESLQSLNLKGRMCISNEIVFSLPKLESLSLVSTSFQSEETLRKLVGACPVLKYLFIEIDFIKSKEYCGLDRDAGIEFRCIISSDSLRRLEALSCATIERKTRFNNLTRLEVTRVLNWSWLCDFLMWADCLKLLIINTSHEAINYEVSIGSECDQVPKCLSTSLRRVSIVDYDDYEGELAMVAYLLKYGSVLELMKIRLLYEDIDTNHKVVKKISKLPRKSSVCEVEFDDD